MNINICYKGLQAFANFDLFIFNKINISFVEDLGIFLCQQNTCFLLQKLSTCTVCKLQKSAVSRTVKRHPENGHGKFTKAFKIVERNKFLGQPKGRLYVLNFSLV